MAKKDNIKVTDNLEIIKKVIESESMLTYLENHSNSKYILINKHITHSDLLTAGKRSEKQGYNHNLLYYLSVPTMEEMASLGNHFETAHQSNITIPRSLANYLGFKDRSEMGKTEQHYLENFANIYLVNDTLSYFTPNYTKQVFDVLGKDYSTRKFNEYNLNLDDGPFTKINLTWAAHGLGTARDIEFHKLRRSLFRTDTLLLLIEKNIKGINIFIMVKKNPKFFTILGIKNNTWLKITETKLKRLMREIGKNENVGTNTGLKGIISADENEIKKEKFSGETTNKEYKRVSRAKQSARRKQLAEEMMNYTVHDNEVFCPITGIRVNFDDVGTLLRASHIKSYRESNEEEKYDINNGILMCANADALFDKHLITIGSDGELILSKLIEQDFQLLRDLLLSKHIFKEILNDQRLHYLEEHRRIFYEKEEIRVSGNIDLGDSEETVEDYLDDN